MQKVDFGKMIEKHYILFLIYVSEIFINLNNMKRKHKKHIKPPAYMIL